jgi:carboxypeptidase family protein
MAVRCRLTPLLARALLLGAMLPVVPTFVPAAQELPAVPAKPGAAKPAAASRPAPAPKATPPVLEGTVRGPDGKPVEGALVVAAPLAWSDEAPPSTRTDAQGRFRLTERKSGPYDVLVQAPGFALARVSRVSPGAPVTVALEKGGAIEGAVRDGTEGRPVARARVEARPVDASRFRVPSDPAAGVVTARTDDKGRYRLEGIGPGEHEVTASAPGFGRARRPRARAGSSIDLFLFSGGWITGTAIASDGQGVSGAMVRAIGEAVLRSSPPTTDTTDRGGAFALTGLDAGPHTVIVRAPDLAPGIATGVAVDRHGETRVDLVLVPGATVSGRLVGPEKRPVRGQVKVQDVEGRIADAAIGEILAADAGEDGRFALAHVPVGRFTLAVRAPRLAPERLEVEVRPQDKVLDVGDVSLVVGRAIRGRVREGSGGPVAEAMVWASHTTPGEIVESDPVEARTEADGSFVLAGLEEGRHQLSARASGYAPLIHAVVADAGAEGVELVLVPGGSITGTVVDEQDRPIDSFRVGADSTGRGPSGRSPREVASPAGRFLIEDLPEGPYVVKATVTGATTATASGVRVVAGAVTDVGKLTVGRGGTVKGVVIDATGEGIPGALLRVRQAVSNPWRAGEQQGESDVNGAFEVTGVPLGRVNLLASHPSFAPSGVSGLDVDPARGPTESRLALARGGRVEGVARRRDGASIPGTRMSVVPVPATRVDAFDLVPVPSQPDGTFVADHVPAGRASVSLLGESAPGQFVSLVSREVDVVEDQTVAVDLSTREVLVTGTVTRGAQPFPGVRLTVSGDTVMAFTSDTATGVPGPRSGPERMAATTREDGTYELIANEPGHVWIEAGTLDGKRGLPGRDATIPDADSFVLDLRYSGAEVSGVVVERETERPVPSAQVSAQPKQGPPSSGSTDADGRFAFDMEPGPGRLRTRARGFATATTEVEIGESGTRDVRIEMVPGAILEGRVTDAARRPLPGITVMAGAGDRADPSEGRAVSLSDGSFSIADLPSRPIDLVAGSAEAGYAVRREVAPGQKDVVMQLRPAGRIRVTIVDPDGSPAAKAYCFVMTVDGARIWIPDRRALPSDAQGRTDLAAPAGRVEFEARKDGRNGSASVVVAPGEVVEARVVLAAPTSSAGAPR